MGEDDFLRAVLADPKDDALLLVYSDWLEERGDPDSAAKADFLRLTAAPARADEDEEKARAERLQALAAPLDTDWLAVVSRLRIENCLEKRKEASSVIVRGNADPGEFRCRLAWEDLCPTAERDVRSCAECKRTVHYCDTITAAREHAKEGHCVAIDLGVIRRHQDLRQPLMWLGQPSDESLRREEELAKPDPVSAERERRKREAAGEV